jgi:hypothetical protein
MIFVKPYYFVAFFAFLAIQVNGQFSVNLGEDKQLCYGEIVFLDAGIYGADYLWSTGDTTRTIKVIAPGSYSVAVIFGGVAASDEVQISFNPTVQNFKIPNVFSPNGDSVNDRTKTFFLRKPLYWMGWKNCGWRKSFFWNILLRNNLFAYLR